MLNRQGDIPYGGLSATKIQSANPTINPDMLGHLKDWITERYNIHIKKDVEKLPAPWTENKILQNVKFTNVRREHDRATKWLIDNVCSTSQPLIDKMLQCIVFRMYNKWETCQLIRIQDITYNNIQEGYQREVDLLKLTEIEDPEYVFFTSAFNTGGLKAAIGRETGEEYIPARPLAGIQHIVECGLMTEIFNAETPKQVCDTLMKFKGIGEFLSYQMFVDFTYCPEYKFSENEFTIAGPGCKLGLNFLFDDNGGLTEEELLFWLRDNQEDVFGMSFAENLMTDLEAHDRVLNVMSLENCFCEFSKYVRCVDQMEQGKQPRARVSYDGSGISKPTKKKPKMKKEPKPTDPNRTIKYHGKNVTPEEYESLQKLQSKIDPSIKTKELYEATLFDPKPEYKGVNFGSREDANIFQILGTNGSGKSTIPKGLVSIDTDAFLMSTEFAWLAGNERKGFEAVSKKTNFATVLPNLGIVLIGDYTPGTNIAGCDLLVSQTIRAAIDIILEDHNLQEYHILMEGVILGSSRWQIDYAKEIGLVPNLLFMDTPFDVCVERLTSRNAKQGKEPPSDLSKVEQKHKDMFRKHQHCVDGSFNYGGTNPVWVDHTLSIEDCVQWFIKEYV